MPVLCANACESERRKAPPQKKPGRWAGWRSFFAVTHKAPAQGGKAGSRKSDTRNIPPFLRLTFDSRSPMFSKTEDDLTRQAQICPARPGATYSTGGRRGHGALVQHPETGASEGLPPTTP